MEKVYIVIQLGLTRIKAVIFWLLTALAAVDLWAGDVRVGAIRWDAWYADETYAPEVRRTLSEPRFNDRLPFFAEKQEDGSFRIDGRPLMCQEIDYAADAGLSYFAFLTYPDGNGLERGLKLFLEAPNRKRLRFALIFR